MLAPAAAGSAFELGDAVHWSGFCFFIPGKVFVFAFALVVAFRQATIGCLAAASALIPIAQTKPSNSRPTAVMILRWSLPAAGSLA